MQKKVNTKHNQHDKQGDLFVGTEFERVWEEDSSEEELMSLLQVVDLENEVKISFNESRESVELTHSNISVLQVFMRKLKAKLKGK